MKKILIHPKLSRDLAEEFKTSYQTVKMSLQYVFNSQKAKEIRLRAKELLLKEVNKIDEEL